MTRRAAAGLAPALQQAIAWEVRLREGDANAAELQQFARWRDSEAAHAAAWDALQRRLGGLPGGAGMAAQAAAQALRTDASERRRLLRGGFGVLALGLCGGAGWRTWHELGLDADWRSATGERRNVRLADGAAMALDAGSRVYRAAAPSRHAGAAADPGALRLRLARGQLLLRAALPAGRALQVESSGALVLVRQAVFNVCQFEHASVLALASGRAELHLHGQAPLPLAPGQTLAFHAGAAELRSASFEAVSAWTRGLFVADRLPLSDLVEVFNRYRSGVIRATGTAAQRRISGVFKLDDIDRAVEQVAEILPLRLRRYGPYLSVLS